MILVLCPYDINVSCWFLKVFFDVLWSILVCWILWFFSVFIWFWGKVRYWCLKSFIFEYGNWKELFWEFHRQEFKRIKNFKNFLTVKGLKAFKSVEKTRIFCLPSRASREISQNDKSCKAASVHLSKIKKSSPKWGFSSNFLSFFKFLVLKNPLRCTFSLYTFQKHKNVFPWERRINFFFHLCPGLQTQINIWENKTHTK